MKIINGYRNIEKLKDPVVTIGIFDGIHLGHQRVIRKLLNKRYKGRNKCLVTFDPHPAKVLDPKKAPPRIMSLEHRISIIEKMGLDTVIVINFSDHIASMSPEDFIGRVLGAIGTRTVYVGGNFRFGKGKSGDVSSLSRIGKEHGIDIHAVPPVKKSGRVVSSTWLRRLISRGDIKKAELLLRRPVSVLGTVVGGEKRGREIGVPTANIDPHHEVIPPAGVYAVKVDIRGRLYDGVLNIGFNPTFYGRQPSRRKEPFVEVHLFSFKGDLYGESPEIFFIRRIRSERRFRDEASLKRQIDRDMKKAEKVLSSKRIAHRIRRYKGI